MVKKIGKKAGKVAAKRQGKKKAVGKRLEDAGIERKLHCFLTEWNDYIRQQIKLHSKIVAGKQSLESHVKETITATEAFAKKLKKLP